MKRFDPAKEFAKARAAGDLPQPGETLGRQGPDAPISDDILAILNEHDPEADAAAEKILADSARNQSGNNGAMDPATITAIEKALAKERASDRCETFTLADLPNPVREEDNPEILIKGRWLERGGAAFVVSTAGTGKSIHSMQLAMCMTVGVPFSGLAPNSKTGLRFWIFQSEDSKTRLAIDRNGIVAELSETNPETDWPSVASKIVFKRFPGKVGTAWIAALHAELAQARATGELPDVVIINPLMAFIGGPITDAAYVTPFLRGGETRHGNTIGLQTVLENFNIGALIYHHTPKPPTEKELDAWMQSRFPEYQCQGSAEITNWGRSFITMMKVKGHANMVCLTAGKNGNDLNWCRDDGANRLYLAWSKGVGFDGKTRHAWRELDETELADVTRNSNAKRDADVQKIAAYFRAKADYITNAKETLKIPEMRWRDAMRELRNRLPDLGLVCKTARRMGDRNERYYFGTQAAVDAAIAEYHNADDDE